MLYYNPKNWFWIIAGDETRAWSSGVGEYVDEWPSDQVTRIASAAELSDVLLPYGLALPEPTIGDYKIAIQAHVDAVARKKDYENGFALAGYVTDPKAEYAGDAQAFINWRSSIWDGVFEILAAVQSGAIPQPTSIELISLLPAPPWPIDE